MAGLVAAKMDAAPSPAGEMPGVPSGKSPESVTYDPERISLDQNTDTVEGRLNSIIDKNSALQQSAATRANEQMASRGLVNSSMAVGAGQKAVIDSALPIATSDAAAMQGVKSSNAQAANAASALGATGAQQQQAITRQGEVQAGLQESQGKIQAGLQESQGKIQAGLQEGQGIIQSRLQQERGEIETALQTADAASKVDLQARAAVIDKELQELKGAQESTLSAQNADQAQAAAKLAGEIELSNQTELKKLDGELDIKLETLKGNYQALITSTQSAANMYAQTSSSISAILAAPKLSMSSKQQIISQEIDLLQNGLQTIGNANNVDFGNLLTFTNTGAPTAPPLPLIVPKVS